jgi:uncharacterized protein YjiS (DUF1127 family)
MTTDIGKAYRTWRRYRKAYQELSGLSDGDLRDIGIKRGEIHSVARRYADS